MSRTRIINPIRKQRTIPDNRAAETTSMSPNDMLDLITQQPDALREWRTLDLGRAPFSKLPPTKLLEILTNTSPEISRALWDFLRFCNPGWTVRAVKSELSDQEVIRGTAVLNQFIGELKQYHGSVDIIIGRLFIGGWLRGGFFGEVVFGADNRTAIDIVTPDPDTIRFKVTNNVYRGRVWQLHQQQAYQVVPIDSPNVCYIPIDPLPGSPYGRSPAYPALFTSLFLLSLLYDIKRVVAQQGYPRIDIEVNLDTLRSMIPGDITNNPALVEEWIDKAIDDIIYTYEQLEPDDSYVHTTAIKVNRPVGTIDSSSLGAVEGLIKSLERMALRGLKTMPLLMGITDGVSEANANRQWEIHVAGIKSLQHLCESLLEHLFNRVLQAQGIQAVTQFRFAELRAAEMLRDEQVRQLIIANTIAEREQGWISQEEAAQKTVGHAPYSMPDMSYSKPKTIPQSDGTQEDGSNRRRYRVRS